MDQSRCVLSALQHQRYSAIHSPLVGDESVVEPISWFRRELRRRSDGGASAVVKFDCSRIRLRRVAAGKARDAASNGRDPLVSRTISYTKSATASARYRITV